MILPSQSFVEGDSEVAMLSNLGDVVVVYFDVQPEGGMPDRRTIQTVLAG